MALAVKINVKGLGDVTHFVRGLPKNMELEVGNAGFDYAVVARDSLKKRLRMVSKQWKGKIFNGIKAKKLSKFRSVVTMPIEGVWLDSMRPHHVSLKPGRLITQWAEDRGYNGRVIFVRPHPFVNDALRNARKRLPVEVRRGVRKAFRKSRR
jgi:hypothetical protein